MHTRATTPCNTQLDNIVLKQITIDMPCYWVTDEEGTPIDPILASYSGEQNLSLPSNLCNLHPTLMSPSLCHITPQTQLSPLPFSSSALSSLLPAHHTLAQSAEHSPLPLSQFGHRSCTLFSFQSIYQSQPPFPPTSFLPIYTHLALHQPSIRFSTIPNFDLPSPSIIRVSSPHAMHSPSSFTPRHPMKHLLASPPPHLTTQTSPNHPSNPLPTLPSWHSKPLLQPF